MDPPPSTYSAQIINIIQGALYLTPPANSRSHVRELLSLILQADRQSASLDAALDPSLEVNQKLIIIIFHACLFPPTPADPFVD